MSTFIEIVLQEISTLQFAAGVDEVGVGPLAGPVISAAVILPIGYHNSNIKDSKKISERQREKLYDEITSVAIDGQLVVLKLRKSISLISFRQLKLL